MHTDIRTLVYALAAAAGCDHRTARAFVVDGRVPAGSLGERLIAAGRAHGVEPRPPEASTRPPARVGKPGR